MELISNLQNRPYYDTSVAEIDRGYVIPLYRPELALQNRELNVSNSMLLHHIKNIGDNIMSNGSIISGCSLYIAPDDAIEKVAYLTEGQIYYGGLLLNIGRAEWRGSDYDFIKSGTKYICLEVVKVAVTADDDPTLMDPADSAPSNYGRRGADRLKYKASAVIYSDSDLINITRPGNTNDGNDDITDIIDIIQTEDGDVTGTTKPTGDTTGKVVETIAKSIFDADGNFIVSGLRINFENDPTDVVNYYINLSEGRCYVLGKEYSFNAQKIKVSSDLEYKELLQDESHTFVDGNYEYYLNYKNVRLINGIQVTIKSQKLLMTKSSTDVDFVLDQQGLGLTVKEIRSIYPDAERPSEDEFVDWAKDGNKIIWTKNGRRPSQGSTYYIDCSYNKKLIEGVDYILITDENGTKIVFIGNEITNNIPEDGSDFYISYSYYLTRYDLLYIDIHGQPKVLNGISGEDWEIFIPQVPIQVLPIAWIKVNPNLNPEQYQYKEYSYYRMSMADLRNIEKRVNNLEYDVSMLKLEMEAQKEHEEKSEDGLLSLKGIFVDGFESYERSDFYHPLYNINVDIFSKEITLPYRLQIYSIKELNEMNLINKDSNLVYDSNNKQGSNIICLPYEELENNAQKYATDTISLNPYKISSGIPFIVADPSFSFYSSSLTMTTDNITSNIMMNMSKIKSEEVENIREAYDILPIEYMEGTVTLSGWNFKPNQWVEIFFDNKPMNAFTASTNNIKEVYKIIGEDDYKYYDMGYSLPSYAETLGGNYLLQAKDNGEIDITFTIPKNVRTGRIKIHTTVYETDDEMIFSRSECKATAYYYGFDYLEEYYYHRDSTNSIYDSAYDLISSGEKTETPLGQSFKYNENIYLAGIDLYFQSKPTATNQHVIFEIKEIVNGIPSERAIYRDIIMNDEIEVSDDSSKATHHKFKYPLYIKEHTEYLFTLGSTDVDTRVWFCKTNNIDRISGTLIESNSHFGCVYLASSGQHWAVIPDSDLKFALYRAKFDMYGEYSLKEFGYTNNIGNFGLINFSVHNIVLDGTNITCKYLPSTDQEWISFPMNEKVFLPSINSEEFRIKLELTTNNDKISPFINMNTIKILLGSYQGEGSYVMRTFQGIND